MKGKVCVLYGLGEGPSVDEEFLKKLQKNGFEITPNASEADYIIAHSGGMLFVPKTYKAKFFLFVGVNNKIDGSVIITQYRKVKQDLIHAINSKHRGYWLKKSCWNLFYLLKEMKKTLFMWQVAHSKQPLIPTLKNAKVIIVTYKDDR